MKNIKEMSIEEILTEFADKVKKGYLINHNNVQYHEILSRFADQKAKIAELEKQAEDIKCCGNCKCFMNDYCHEESYTAWHLCELWQSDNLTREERK